jgi:hypothetical protein
VSPGFAGPPQRAVGAAARTRVRALGTLLCAATGLCGRATPVWTFEIACGSCGMYVCMYRNQSSSHRDEHVSRRGGYVRRMETGATGRACVSPHVRVIVNRES